MEIDSLNTFVAQKIKAQKPFVVYRFPNDTSLSLIEADEVTFLVDFSVDESGFMFHPFDSKVDKIELLKGSAVTFSFDKKESNPLSTQLFAAYAQPISTLKEEYAQQFQYYHNAIVNKEIKKAILSRVDIVAQSFIDIENTFATLLTLYPLAYVYCYFSPSAGLWFGASPEKFIHLHNNVLETTALAGTISEGEVWTRKEQEEQMIVTHFISQNLHELNNLEADSPETIKAGDLYHIKANIRGEITPSTPLTSIVNNLHPTPAVGGFPKKNALQIIANTEKHKREYYSGFAGLVSKTSAHLFVNIRCAKAVENGLAVYVGGGITRDSNANKEWEELNKKALTIIKAL